MDEFEFVKNIPTPRDDYYCILASWHDGHWKIFPALYKYPDGDDIKADIADAHNRGWREITICKIGGNKKT